MAWDSVNSAPLSWKHNVETDGRYHSLYTDRGTFPDALAITAESDEGIVMAVEHPDLPVAAVQFHPESILTLDEDAGMAVVMNVMRGLGR